MELPWKFSVKYKILVFSSTALNTAISQNLPSFPSIDLQFTPTLTKLTPKDTEHVIVQKGFLNIVSKKLTVECAF